MNEAETMASGAPLGGALDVEGLSVLTIYAVAAGRRITLADFSSRLIAWRHERGLSRRELAALSDVSESLIWKWETEKASPSVMSANRVLAALETDPARFFSLTPSEVAAEAEEQPRDPSDDDPAE